MRNRMIIAAAALVAVALTASAAAPPPMFDTQRRLFVLEHVPRGITNEVTAKELREERAKIATEIRKQAEKVNAEKRDFTSEEKPGWEKVNADYDALSTRIDIAERAEKVAAEQKRAIDDGKGKPKPGRDDINVRDRLEQENRDDEDDDKMTDAELGIDERSVDPRVFSLGLQGWMRRCSGMDVEERHIKAARIAGISLARSSIDIQLNRRAMTPREQRAMSAVDVSVGASTIAPTFSGSFEAAMLAFGGMRNVAETIRTDTGAELPWPTVNDTSNEGAIVGENTASATTPDPTTGAIRWFAHKYTSKIIQVPEELLEDSAFDLASEIGRMLGERIARRQNRDFTVGDASSKPKGIVTAATLGVTAAGTTAFTADELVNLIHSVDPAYRNGAKLMFSDAALLVARKLKDSQNRYLFQDAAAGASPTIWGVGYEINQHMPAMTTGQKPVIFGQLNKYKIRDVRAIRFRRLVERYADADQEGFVAFMRSDGNLLDAGVAPVKYLQLA